MQSLMRLLETVNNIKEQVLDGYDLKSGAHVPYIPWAKFYYYRF